MMMMLLIMHVLDIYTKLRLERIDIEMFTTNYAGNYGAVLPVEVSYT